MVGQVGAEQDWAARLKAALAHKDPASAATPSDTHEVETSPETSTVETASAPPPALLAALHLEPLAPPPPPQRPSAAAPDPGSLLALLQPPEASSPKAAPEVVPVQPVPPPAPPAPEPAVQSPVAEVVQTPVAEVVQAPVAEVVPLPPALPAAPLAQAPLALNVSVPETVPGLPVPQGTPPPRALAKPEPVFDLAEFPKAHAALMGAPPDTKQPKSDAAAQDEVISLVRSLAEVEGSWHLLVLGARTVNSIMAAGLAAKRRGLMLRMQVIEPNPEPFSRIYAAFAAEDFTAIELRLQQADVCATTATLAPRAAVAEQLLAEMPRCDYLRLDVGGLVSPLLSTQLDLLTDKVRWLSIATRSRADEHQAFKFLGQRGWQLMADHPCRIDRLAPPRLSAKGMQIWRSPLA